ncbi:MAG: AMP-binding protein, partial [Rhodoferax sp.]|nr:AMP-binding protein [Rhodoferax sp.]
MPASPRSPKRDTAVVSNGAPAAYQQLHRQFSWKVPKRFNMAAVCAARWARAPDSARRIAIRSYQEDGSTQSYSYAQLQTQANRLSNALRAQGVLRGDRVAIVMPQCFDTAVAYIAVLQMGAVAMPLSMLFGPEALAYRLQDSEAVLAICHDSEYSALMALQPQCPQLRVVRSAQAPQSKASFKPVSTLAEEPAVLIYTSGTTGNPKGALIPHRALIGNLTGFVCSQNWFGFDPAAPALAEGALPKGSDAVFWSPADWAWTGGLMDALLPTLYFGREIVAYGGRFGPEVALQLMAR